MKLKNKFFSQILRFINKESKKTKKMQIKVIGVEYAKSGRSTCSRCERKIKLVRVANDEMSLFTQGTKFNYYIL